MQVYANTIELYIITCLQTKQNSNSFVKDGFQFQNFQSRYPEI